MPEASNKADVGFPAERLDPAIDQAIDRLTKCVTDVERIRGALEPQLDAVRTRLTSQLAAGNVADATLIAQAERLIDWLEKYARTALTLTKLTDDAARLRSFVAGGADSRPDLSSMSDSELSEYVRRAAAPK